MTHRYQHRHHRSFRHLSSKENFYEVTRRKRFAGEHTPIACEPDVVISKLKREQTNRGRRKFLSK